MHNDSKKTLCEIGTEQHGPHESDRPAPELIDSPLDVVDKGSGEREGGHSWLGLRKCGILCASQKPAGPLTGECKLVK